MFGLRSKDRLFDVGESYEFAVSNLVSDMRRQCSTYGKSDEKRKRQGRIYSDPSGSFSAWAG